MKELKQYTVDDFSEREKWLPDLKGGQIYKDDIKTKTVSDPKNIKGSKFDSKLFFRNIKVESSLTKKEYESKDYIYQKLYLKDESHYRDCPIRLLKEENGQESLVLNFDYYNEQAAINILLHCLTKYYSLSKSFDYYCGQSKEQYIFIIGCPTSKKGYDDIISVFTEFLSDLRFYIGVYSKAVVLDRRNPKKLEEKKFSSVASVIVGGSYLLISNPVRVGLLRTLSSSNFRNKALTDKLLKIIKSDSNLIYSNIGSGSFFLDRNKLPDRTKQYLLSLEKKSSKISVSDPRTKEDYIVKAIKEEKDLINYSDVDSITALAHEYGHYCVKRNPFLNKLQGNRLLMKLAKMSGFQFFVSSILGLTGQTTWATITPIIMSSPVLVSEFAASYYGIKTLKGLGATEEDIKAMKRDMSAAFGTYLHSTLGRSALGMTIGGLANMRKEEIKNNNDMKININPKTFSKKEKDPEADEKLELNLKRGAVSTGLAAAASLGAERLGKKTIKKLGDKASDRLKEATAKAGLAGRVTAGATAAFGAATAYQHYKNKKKKNHENPKKDV